MMRPCRSLSGDGIATGASLPARRSTLTGGDYQVLFTSWSSTVVAAAVLAGMAVSVLPESALRTGMKVLTAAMDFRPFRRCKYRSDETAGPITLAGKCDHRPHHRLPRQHLADDRRGRNGQ